MKNLAYIVTREKMFDVEGFAIWDKEGGLNTFFPVSDGCVSGSILSHIQELVNGFGAKIEWKI